MKGNQCSCRVNRHLQMYSPSSNIIYKVSIVVHLKSPFFLLDSPVGSCINGIWIYRKDLSRCRLKLHCSTQGCLITCTQFDLKSNFAMNPHFARSCNFRCTDGHTCSSNCSMSGYCNWIFDETLLRNWSLRTSDVSGIRRSAEFHISC